MKAAGIGSNVLMNKKKKQLPSFYDKLEIHYLSLILSGDMVAAERLRGTLLLSSKNVTGGLKLSEKLISNPGMWRIGNCVNEKITRLREKPTKSSDEYQLIVDRCFKQEEMEKN